MKKVAIITIESMNFGNRLQNYAMQELIKEQGFYVETIHRILRPSSVYARLKRFLQFVLQTKAEKFYRFDKNINFSNIVIGKDDYPMYLNDRYDFFIAGSDQIWNPYFDFTGGECDFLSFATPKKKIAYAASFGVSEIPINKREYFSKKIRDFAALSVREDVGVKIIKELANRDATLVLDPTLMLDEEKWYKLCRRSNWIPKDKYVLVYALGEKSSEFCDAIEHYSQMYEIFDVLKVQKNGREIPIGPSEFLYAIDHACIILTDSFHCSVFSILFQKTFFAFDRPGLSMNSRITTLYGNLGIHNTDYMNIQIDYNLVKNRIGDLRETSLDYLANALKS